jgi:hypothetical protein
MAKLDGKTEIVKAALSSGFQYDPRAKHAYKLPNIETWRLDLGGARTVRLERRSVGTWAGYSEPLYYGQVASAEFAKHWIEWAAATIRAGRAAGPEPRPVPTEKELKKKEQQRVQSTREHERKHGRGFYVTNQNAAGSLTKPRIANHGPYATLDEAIDQARLTLREYLQMKFGYLLPVEVVEGASREKVEHGEGHTWWINGKYKGPAPDPRQLRMFGNVQPVAKAIRKALTPELLHEPYRSRVASGRCDPVTGHCYVASEAAYHLLGGKAAGWTPMFIQHEGAPHWFLRGPRGQVLDITSAQFKTDVPYSAATAKGFLTREPSARARTVIERARRVAR